MALNFRQTGMAAPPKVDAPMRQPSRSQMFVRRPPAPGVMGGPPGRPPSPGGGPMPMGGGNQIAKLRSLIDKITLPGGADSPMKQPPMGPPSPMQEDPSMMYRMPPSKMLTPPSMEPPSPSGPMPSDLPPQPMGSQAPGTAVPMPSKLHQPYDDEEKEPGGVMPMPMF